eukprot:1203905-Prymnesium_polylepis.1
MLKWSAVRWWRAFIIASRIVFEAQSFREKPVSSKISASVGSRCASSFCICSADCTTCTSSRGWMRDGGMILASSAHVSSVGQNAAA